MTLANKITLLRVALIPLFLACVFLKAQPLGTYLAAGVFTIAALTDSIDGWVARVQSQVTAMGKFLDPLADKILVSAALISLVSLGRLAAWVAVVIIAREFAVSALRLVAVTEGVVIAAGPLGKLKTLTQVSAIIVILVGPLGSFFGHDAGWWLMGAALLLTLLSGLQYFLRSAPVWEGKGSPTAEQ